MSTGCCVKGTVGCEEPHGHADNVLLKAYDLIHGDREQDYGHPSDNFENIARQWTEYLRARGFIYADVKVNEQDVCNMMILLKLIREATTGKYKEDSVVDIAGYAGLKERLHTRS